ncbi:MAG: hypothetical protein ACK56I_16010, partial [bacterium]
MVIRRHGRYRLAWGECPFAAERAESLADRQPSNEPHPGLFGVTAKAWVACRSGSGISLGLGRRLASLSSIAGERPASLKLCWLRNSRSAPGQCG